MKILAIPFTVDLSYRHGIAPSWWQLFKALNEVGTEVIVTPYAGRCIETLWWKSYENPCWSQIAIIRFASRRFFKPSSSTLHSQRLGTTVLKAIIQPKWREHLERIFAKERDISAVLMLGVPINQFSGIPNFITKEFGVPTFFVEGDMPVALPSYQKSHIMSLNYYLGADLGEYDGFITNSKGAINSLKSLGAKRIHVMYYGADIELFTPLRMKKDIDIFFYGGGTGEREDWTNYLITRPSTELSQISFFVGGPPNTYKTSLGRAKMVGEISYSRFKYYCCRSKVNLNITRRHHAYVYASSTARLFELAAMGCCIVSNPLAGMQEWFNEGREILVAHNAEEAIELYRWLIGSPKDRKNIGENARSRVIRDHAYKERARELLSFITIV